MKSPLVSIIIPVYNKADKLAAAITSAAGQTYKNIEIIVVNDGSTDDSADVARDTLRQWEDLIKCTYVYQENGGVATARNNGVFNHSRGDLILCLDADDQIGKDYLSLLVPVLWTDRELGVVYTNLLNVNKDGSRKVSPWPGPFDADKHFFGNFNQVPTAALARREVWTRLGGQRQRYAPQGAGAEDGDFWLRAGTYGFGIKFIQAPNQDAMFHYSTYQGNVSGNRSYREVDWRSWSPWTKNRKLMPTPSVAPAAKFSHPARAYEEPIVSVIIPVGPGHSKHLVDSLDSLDAQTLKKWEAIVIFDIDDYEWSQLKMYGELEYIEKTWPFCRFTSTHANGKFARELTDTLDVAIGRKASILAGLPAGEPRGPAVARNIGIQHSRAPLLIFLDADDYFLPTALEKMVTAYYRERKIIFAEHYGVAPVNKEDLHLVHGEVVFYNDINGLAVIKQGVTDYDCEKAAQQPYTDGRVPYIICNVSSLIPRKWALELGGFPEDLPSWEDVLFWWGASWNGYCFYKINEPLLAYRYHTGLRRERGREIATSLLQEIKKRKEGVKLMGCRCGQAPGAGTVIDAHGALVQDTGEGMATLRLSRGGQLQVEDRDLVLVTYEPPDRGDKLRFGQHDFGGGNFINYGRLSGGEQIFVHGLDIDADLSISVAHGRNPVYRPVAETLVEEEREELGEPEILGDVEHGEVFAAELPEDDGHFALNPPAELEEYFPERAEGEVPRRLTPVDDFDTGDLRNPGRYADILKAEGIETAWDIVRFLEENDSLQEIDGIGPKAAAVFEEVARGLVA